VRDGEFLAILGPSACGKTTLLKVLAGLLPPTAGKVTKPRAASAGLSCGLLFQDLALFPWKTVRENVAVAFKLKGRYGAEQKAAVSHYLRKMKLGEYEEFYPHQLSGGMKQRVALARIFASDPDVMLMDEPFGALDAATRRLLQEELVRLWESRRKTVVFVTHSITEALFLSDRILVLSARPGKIIKTVQVPFARPRSYGILADSRFSALESEMWGLLEGEVEKSLKDAGQAESRNIIASE
jgi:NitT/TauT family transport system ATP-binding protein